jgi:LacI family transcriptional regulator
VKTHPPTRRKLGKATIHDVAAAARVSIATVSRALNTPERVRAELRARVRGAVDRLGYVTHGAARALASRRSHTIAAIVPTLDNAIFAAGINALQLRLDELGYVLLVASTEYDRARELRALRALVERGVDAVMLVGAAQAPDAAALLRRAGVPVVSTWICDAAAPWPTIGFDNARAMARVVDHLWSLGHRRFAMIAGIAEGNDRAARRIAGVRRALAGRARKGASLAVVERPYAIREGRNALRELMAARPRPSAIICGNDVLALGALFEAQAAGLRVPRDVSITGFDDLELASHVVPGLTTIRIPAAEMGRLAAEQLVARLLGRPALATTELDVELILRGSTGPVPRPN